MIYLNLLKIYLSTKLRVIFSLGGNVIEHLTYLTFHKTFLLISRDFLIITYVRNKHAIQLTKIVTGRTNAYDLILPTGIRKLSVMGVL